MKRVEQAGDAYDGADKVNCKAYVDALNAYAKAKCLSEEETKALEMLAASLKRACE
ncbi:MAG: hypothetical protein ACTHMM_05845 [Agriterribacter sp.]